MGVIYDTTVQFFKEEEWVYTELEGKPALSLSYAGKSGTWSCFAKAEEEKEMLLFYSYCPVKVPENKRPLVGDFLTRANYGLLVGNFEMDYNDGEVRYKTSIDVEGDRLSAALVKRLVYDNLAVMDRYLPGVLSVIYGGASPTEAIAQVES
ncbi:MAG TPA: YbjN domain-containing protein [Chloroflexia bacterium]|nr:YbjN domain-containing protein [Chloroflexia bacterium]